MSNLNDTTIKAYEKGVQTYIDHTPRNVDGDLKIWIDKLLSEMKKDAKIFEIGSAFGRDADYMEEKGFKVQRSDATKAFVEYLQTHGHETITFNALRDAFKDRYDAVFADAVFLHFNREELAELLKKILNTLNGDGLVAFSLKEGDGEEVTDQKMGSDRYFCYWRESDIVSLLKDVGFLEIRVIHAADHRPNKPSWLFITAKKDKHES